MRSRMLLASLLLVMVTGWFTRGLLFEGVGDLLVSEDALERTGWLVLSGADAGATSLEGVQLYREAVAMHVLVVSWKKNPLEERIEALGIRQPTPNELITSVLEKGGVPSAAISVVSGAVDGTESEISVVADFARAQGVSSLLYVTTRTHTARARYLLKRRLGKSARVLVRASRFDPFTSTAWWHNRDQSREVLAEYLRWTNSLVLSDLWQP